MPADQKAVQRWIIPGAMAIGAIAAMIIRSILGLPARGGGSFNTGDAFASSIGMGQAAGLGAMVGGGIGLLVRTALDKMPTESVPEGFERRHRRLRVNDRVFHSTEGEGVVVGEGQDRHFVRVRFDKSGDEREMESYGLAKRIEGDVAR